MTEITRPPYSGAALGYGILMTLGEFLLLGISPPLFRAVLIADAATGWFIVMAATQGLRAVAYPPPVRYVSFVALATGHWLAALLWTVSLFVAR